jgi:hypothetical protein
LVAVALVTTTQTRAMKTVFSAKNITMISKLKHFVPPLVVNHLEIEKFLFLQTIIMLI